MKSFYERYSRFVIFIFGIILFYFGFIKKDVDSPVVSGIAFLLILNGIYGFWQFYKKNDTIELKDKW